MTEKISIKYTTVENDAKGIVIGEENLFLEVKYQSENKEPWGFKLIEMREWKPQTAWISEKTPGKLRTSHKARILRNILKNVDGIIVDEVLESVIREVQDHEQEWKHKDDNGENEVQVTGQSEGEKKEIKNQALEFLKDPLLLHIVKKDMEKWIVGEEATSLLNWVLNTSCKAKRDYAFQIVSADSAAGKTWLVSHVLSYLPKEWWRKVGRLSRTSLDYLKDKDFNLLWIQERRGGKEAADSIRLSSVEDGGTEIWVTGKNDSGQLETQVYKVKGRSILTTTTNTKIDIQDLTRSWLLGVDESEEQTVLIHDYEVGEAEEPLELKEALGIVEKDLRPVIREALRQLDWDKIVIVPFAEQFKPFVSQRMLRSRRDLKKLIRLVRVLTLLFQKQRHCFEIREKKFVVAYPQDAYNALMIAAETFHRTSMGLDEREKKVIDILKDLEWATRRDVGQKCAKSMTWAYDRLEALIDKGFVDKDESGKTHQYTLRKECFNPSLSVTNRLDYPVLEKKVRAFLDQSYVTVTEADNIIFQYFDPLTGNENNNMRQGVTVTHHDSEQATSSVDEKEQENPSKNDNDGSEGVVQGPIPLRQKKKETINIDEAFKGPSIGELEQQLQEEWTKGIAEDFIELIHGKSRLDKIEATNFLAQLIEDGKMGYDPEGLLVWAR